MSALLIASCLWVVAAAITSFLPMRLQRWIGLPLLLAVPILLVLLGREFGVWLVLAGLFAFVSMFRRPLLHLLGWLLGKVRA